MQSSEPLKNKFEAVRDLLDSIIDQCSMEKTVEAIDAVTAIDRLHKAVNRKDLVEGKRNDARDT